MRLDDEGLCWLCDKPLESERSATSWHGFGVHRACAREQETRVETRGGLDNCDVMRTST
jgi:hypothetical protein